MHFRFCFFNNPTTGSIKYWNWPKSCILHVYVIKLCDLKMDVIKWPLNFVWYNFGLKSCDFIPRNHVLWPRSIWKSRVYDFRPNDTPLSSITIMNHLWLNQVLLASLFYRIFLLLKVVSVTFSCRNCCSSWNCKRDNCKYT